MLSLFKKLKYNYTQTFIYISRLCASECIFPLFKRYFKIIPLKKKVKKYVCREYILVIKKKHMQK